MTKPSTIACRDEDFVDWHGGCRFGALWAVDVDTPHVRNAVDAVRHHMRDLILPRYQRQPHITIAYCGPIVEAGCTPADIPYTPERFDADLAALRATRPAPFTVRIDGWGTFPMVPYLPATAPELQALNRTLNHSPTSPDAYTPHVTAGQYAVEIPLAEVEARAHTWPPPDPVDIPVDAVHLMTYETRDIAGPLRIRGTFFLADGSWVGDDFRHTCTRA